VAGAECGFMIAGEGHVIYVTGDTGIMADMGWMGEYYAPDIGILCAGGHYTMDMAGAAWAAKRFFDFKTVIPCHYKTFGLLEQSADALVAGLPGVQVLLPDVMETITIPAQ
jgi:L-ascorbate metabolism protein UlaG (beta-lactamase superfamily)